MKDGKPLILAIDDERAIRDLIGYALEPTGFDVLFAENGKAALTIFDKEEVDVVVTDLLMPSMTGLEFIRELKKANSDVPIIIITAYGNMEMAREIVEEGIFKLIEKPLDFDVIVPIVEEALKERGVI